MKLYVFRYNILVFLIIPLIFNAQNTKGDVPDSLGGYSFDELVQKIGVNTDFLVREIYSKAFLKKAKLANDTTNIMNGYDILAGINKAETALKYIDSLIPFCLQIQDSTRYTEALVFKGDTYYSMRNFKNALDNYLMANKLALNLSNSNLEYLSGHGIGTLKLRIGDYEDALKIHENNLSYVENQKNLGSLDNYITTLFSIAVACRKLNKLKLASIYNKLGVQLSIKNHDDKMINLFILNEGTVHYQRGNLETSLDSIIKAKDYLEKKDEKAYLAFVYYYLGEIYFKKKEEEIALDYLKKVDTIFQETNDIHPETEPTYKLLTNYYKEKDKPNEQLLYLDKLIIVDSTLNVYRDYLAKGITEKYDIPKLMVQRDKLIATLQKDKFSLYYVLLITFLTVLLGYLIFRRRQLILRKRFNALLEISKNDKSFNSKKNKGKGIEDIPPEIIEKILVRLEEFEKKNGFTKRNLTLIDLSKIIDTNSNYLSKIINTMKNVNFSTYLNELRLNYALKELKTSKKFQNYKINSIAREVGFNNSQTFSKLFKKKTGIYPSYFIEQLKKNDEG